MKTDPDPEAFRRKLEQLANRMAERLKAWLPAHVGFVLLVFDQRDKPAGATPEHPHGWLAYASSVTRDGGAAMVEGLFSRWRRVARPPLTPADLDDITRALILEGGLTMPDGSAISVGGEGVRRLAAAAAKLGASADLARSSYAERGRRPS